VLDHDDRVVDHEPGRDGERHHRQVVDAVAEQVHDAEGADQGEGHHHAGNRGGPHVPQEHEHDQHDERDGDEERELDVGDGRANGRAAVDHHRQVDGSGYRGPKLWEWRLYAVDLRAVYCAGLPEL